MNGLRQSAREVAQRSAVPAVDPDAEIEVCRVLLVKAQAAMQLALSGTICRGQEDQRMREIERGIRSQWVGVIALQKGRWEERES